MISQLMEIDLVFVIIPSLACSRPPPGRTSWLSVCDEGSRARLCQTSWSGWRAFLIPSGQTCCVCEGGWVVGMTVKVVLTDGSNSATAVYPREVVVCGRFA